ncbi:MAG: hypothetical protein OQL28_16205 [Sedimenticola sp.]|nr:hypothetical protein [Sedimenticola sp.]
MTHSKYRLVFSGKLLEGFKHHEVKQSLAQLLKIPMDQAGFLVQGDRFRINKPLEREKAERLLKKVTARGAQCSLEPVGPDEDEGGVERDRPRDGGAATPVREEAPEEGALSLDMPGAEHGEEERLSLDLPRADEGDGLSLDLDAEDSGSGLTPERPELTPEDDATRPMSIVEIDDGAAQDEEDIVLASDSVNPADYEADDDSENLGTFYERSTRVEDEPGAGQSRQKTYLLVGGLLLVLVALAAWQFYPMLAPSPAEPTPEVAIPAKPVDPQLAQTTSRLEALNRSIRIWMIQFGSGFNPEQVTLDRLQRDLQIGDQEMLDGWGTALQYEPGEKVYQVISAGPDRQFGTDDDLRRQTEAK